MLTHIQLKDTGPAALLDADFAPRLNVITGDNGLGKTFLLNAAWYTLTGNWCRQSAAPRLGEHRSPRITARFDAISGVKEFTAHWRPETQVWRSTPGRPPIPGLILYAQVDGGFSVWDPHRNYWRNDDPVVQERLPAYVFKADQVWDGFPLKDGKTPCKGLISDWGDWQRDQDIAFKQLTAVLDKLSPSASEKLVPGPLRRISWDDSRSHPTLKFLGEETPLIFASAAIRRIVAMAYLLVWSWREHQLAGQLMNKKPVQEVIFLIDELECHLHPKWQRTLLPALLDVMNSLTGEARVQLLVATHSPLVLASVEPYFDRAQDKVLLLEVDEDQGVRLEEFPWAAQGDASSWLVSDLFGLRQARSLEAEQAIQAANHWMLTGSALNPEWASAEHIHQRLLKVLPGHDPFWPRWIVKREQHI